MSLHVVILAAGAGTRMQSTLPKVLHLLAGKPLLQHVIETAQRLDPSAIHVIYGHGGEKVKQQLQHLAINWIEQTQQLGTAHAVAQALPQLASAQQVLILYGDVPLVSLATLQALSQTTPASGLGIVSAVFDNPTGLGRIVRDANHQLLAVVEEKDATSEEKQIQEINGGIMLVNAKLLATYLPLISNQNAQHEYYLPDLIKLVQATLPVVAVLAQSSVEIQGVNDRKQLAELERCYQLQMAHQILAAGASITDPARFDVRGQLTVEPDSQFDINVIIEGQVHVGRNTRVGPNTVLRNTTLGDEVTVLANCVIDGAIIDAGSTIGPFAHIRPGTHLKVQTKIGNFVEIKKSIIGAHSKISHLSYIGDTVMGQSVNIGAGTITCNYDGVNKNTTQIGDHVFVGSNTQLIAPISLGDYATVGAGTTVTKNVPAYTLIINSREQRFIAKWQRPVKKETKV